MTADYSAVAKALAAGTDPAMLCRTCPWDRYCVDPPTMTKADVDKLVADAAAADDVNAAKAAALGQPPPMGSGSLLATVIFGGRDLQAYLCPVFTLRLRSSGGRRIADGLKAEMQGWDDQA